MNFEHNHKKRKTDSASLSSRPRCDTNEDTNDELSKKPTDGEPYFRCRRVDLDEEKKRRKEEQACNAQALYGNFVSRDFIQGVNDQDA